METYIGWTDVWLGAGLRALLAWGPRWSGVASTIYDGESQRHGVAGSRRRTRDDGRAQGGGAVCRRGGVDGRPDKVNALIPPEDGFAKDGGGGFWSVGVGAR